MFGEPDDCSEKELEERLAEAARVAELAEVARVVGVEGRYREVDEYDPVLRWHCRLGEKLKGG